MVENTLGGEVSSQLTFNKPDDYAAALETARREQQEICGYPLRVKSTRQTHSVVVDPKTNLPVDVYEVFATFEPVPQEGIDGTAGAAAI